MSYVENIVSGTKVNDILFNVKLLYGLKKTPIDTLQELINEINTQKINELAEFQNEVCNCFLKFEKDIDEMIEKCKIKIRDERINSKMLLLIKSSNKTKNFTATIQKIRDSVNSTVHNNKHLNAYINYANDIKGKNVNEYGFKFLSGILMNDNICKDNPIIQLIMGTLCSVIKNVPKS